MKHSVSSFLDDEFSSVEEIFGTEENYKEMRRKKKLVGFLRAAPVLLFVGHVLLSSLSFFLTKRGDHQKFTTEVRQFVTPKGVSSIHFFRCLSKASFIFSLLVLPNKWFPTSAQNSKATCSLWTK
eukprot:scaffold4056_cov115-Cylindrotheca_fusiformis.AAC.2